MPDGAMMSVVGILAEAHVRNHDQFGRNLFDAPNALRHDPIGIIIAAAARVLHIRDSKQNDRWNTQIHNLADLITELVGRDLKLPGHR